MTICVYTGTDESDEPMNTGKSHFIPTNTGKSRMGTKNILLAGSMQLFTKIGDLQTDANSIFHHDQP